MYKLTLTKEIAANNQPCCIEWPVCCLLDDYRSTNGKVWCGEGVEGLYRRVTKRKGQTPNVITIKFYLRKQPGAIQIWPDKPSHKIWNLTKNGFTWVVLTHSQVNLIREGLKLTDDREVNTLWVKVEKKK